MDITRAYHFGARYNVEIEIILPGDMSVRESHDIALELQHKVRSNCIDLCCRSGLLIFTGLHDIAFAASMASGWSAHQWLCASCTPPYMQQASAADLLRRMFDSAWCFASPACRSSDVHRG